MAGAVKNACDVSRPSLHRSYNIGLIFFGGIQDTLNYGVLILLTLLYSRRQNSLFTWVLKYSTLGFYCKRKFKCSGTQRFSNFLTIWTCLLNLMLIVLCNPSIVNPGPPNEKNITVMYQNVRGFVPFSCLGDSVMSLSTDKIIEFQSYVYNENPDVVILNETWLSKEHLDNELFPNDTYKVFRLDRSNKTHPPDALNPKKYKVKGGGVLVAVKANIEVETVKINSKSKAEILSISLKNRYTNICITTCYRVGTLGEQNLHEIENHLRNIASMKKYKAHIIIGDFNLSHTIWNGDGSSPIELERGFVDLFNDLGLTQIIEGPTHEKGKTLDLLLTNTVGVLNNVEILEKNCVCSSDHRGITFSIKMKVKSKATKKRIYNYKKANWDKLNEGLRSINWDRHLQYCDTETAWLRFKSILSHYIELNIPTITIKNRDRPFWYDSDTHNLCRKKERLRAKFKETNRAEDYKKYSQCRKDFKNLVREKMNSNFEDHDDPALISKNFWTRKINVKICTNSIYSEL